MNIAENQYQHLAAFIRLNEEWISRYFAIEDADRALAANPRKVIDDGGYLFSLTLGDDVVGVCALFNEGAGTYELARMAVSGAHQGRGYGQLLMQACLSKLVAVKARKVYLVSNTKLAPAIALYKKHGFVTITEGPHPVYSRANIVMERDIP
jgi:ribosomal protein S18 acetylase RimI-like enzyme